MHPFEKMVLKNCRANKLVEPRTRLIAGVSGGPDSMAMLYALAALADLLEITIFVAHANHGLRPAESPAEETFVQAQCKSLALDCLTSELEVRSLAKARGLSLEQAARELRYDFFATAAHSLRAKKIAVAHNADDQAEEVLLRLLRGTGSKGLAGMEMIRDNKIIRPLLNIPRTAIMRYLHDKNIPYMLDSSNTDRRYRRNRVRLDLLPELAAEFNPRIKQTLRQTAEILRAENKVLDKITAQAYRQAVIETCDAGGERAIDIDLPYFTCLDTAIKRRIIEKAILVLNRQPGFKQIEAIMRAVVRAPHIIHLAGGLRACRDEPYLRLFFAGGQTGRRQNIIDMEPVRFDLTISGPGCYTIPEINYHVNMIILAGPLALQELHVLDADYLDYDKLSYPLQLRSRRDGDFFRPLGCSGHKRVGKFLSDLKMPMQKRRLVPVLLSANKIAALPGICIAEEFRLTAGTGRSLKITLRSRYK